MWDLSEGPAVVNLEAVSSACEHPLESVRFDVSFMPLKCTFTLRATHVRFSAVKAPYGYLFRDFTRLSEGQRVRSCSEVLGVSEGQRPEGTHCLDAEQGFIDSFLIQRVPTLC